MALHLKQLLGFYIDSKAALILSGATCSFLQQLIQDYMYDDLCFCQVSCQIALLISSAIREGSGVVNLGLAFAFFRYH